MEEINLKPIEILNLLRLEFPEYDFESKIRIKECVYIRAIFYKYCFVKGGFSQPYIGSLLNTKRKQGSVILGIECFDSLINSKDNVFNYLHKRALNVLKNGYNEESKDDIINRQKNYISVLRKEIEKINIILKRNNIK